MEKLINFSELSRLVTSGNRNAIRPTKIPKKWWSTIDELVNLDLPKWWEEKKKELEKKE